MMRAPSAFTIAVSLILLSACGRSADDAHRVQVGSIAEEPTVSAPTPRARSLGQPRLSRLIANQETANATDSRNGAVAPNATNAPAAPLATFSRYNGRGPGDASVPSDIASSRGRATDLAPYEPPQLRDDLPPRDVVDVGLNRPVATPKPAVEPTRVASVRRAPSPTPRPVAATPTPTLRPVVEARAPVIPNVVPPAPAVLPAAPALPAAPEIAALRAPTLGSGVNTDAAPTGLPVLRSVEQAVPLGTVPASLGVANIQAGEAALPTGDQLEQSVADESGALSWTQAEALIRAGEVESATDIGEFEVLLSLCSGRGVLTIQPTPTALADIEMPKVICGKSGSLTSQ